LPRFELDTPEYKPEILMPHQPVWSKVMPGLIITSVNQVTD